VRSPVRFLLFGGLVALLLWAVRQPAQPCVVSPVGSKHRRLAGCTSFWVLSGNQHSPALCRLSAPNAEGWLVALLFESCPATSTALRCVACRLQTPKAGWLHFFLGLVRQPAPPCVVSPVGSKRRRLAGCTSFWVKRLSLVVKWGNDGTKPSIVFHCSFKGRTAGYGKGSSHKAGRTV